MTARPWAALPPTVLGLALLLPALAAQPPGGFGPPGFGPGGPGGPMGQPRKLVKQFDKDGDGRLNAAERKAAREFLKKEGGGRGFGPPGFGPPGFGRRGDRDPPKPGPRLRPSEVKTYPDAGLYEPTVLRTLFLDFEEPDWEAELQEFHGTDVQVPATLTVDGKTYPNVGVHFRGMSSYMTVPMGSKRSLGLSMDYADKKQRLSGHKSLNLLNSHEDPSFLGAVLYSHVARQYIPCPKANVVKVVINGESWGVYMNVQQFNKEFTQEHYKTAKGARWKVRGSPGARGGLEYWGDDPEPYKRVFTIKSEDKPESWQALIHLCKVLNQTPPDRLEAALAPILDLDGLLWFLALDVALVNNDGYWTRASDYSLYLDPKGKFHVIPSDMNEGLGIGFAPPGGGFGPPGGGFVMRPPQPGEILPPPVRDMLNLTDEQRKRVAELQKEVDGKVEAILTAEQRKQLKDLKERGPDRFPGGPGGFGLGPMGGGATLDPLVGLDNPRMPLRSKVLAVPALRATYLDHVRTIAAKSLDWKNLGPVVAQYRALIEKEVEADTRKLESFEAFQRATADAPPPNGGRGRGTSFRAFADQRRKFLLDYKEAGKEGTP